MAESPKVPLHIRDEPVVTISQAEYDQLLEALKGVQSALLSAILFIEGAFPERSGMLQQELTSYRMHEARACAALAKEEK